jgi:hypothetical protein
MRIGIGLPAAVPGVNATTVGTWAAEADACTPHRLVEEIREPRDNCVDLIRMKA